MNWHEVFSFPVCNFYSVGVPGDSGQDYGLLFYLT